MQNNVKKLMTALGIATSSISLTPVVGGMLAIEAQASTEAIISGEKTAQYGGQSYNIQTNIGNQNNYDLSKTAISENVVSDLAKINIKALGPVRKNSV